MNKKKKRKREGVVLIRVTSPASQTASVLSFQLVKRTKMGILPVGTSTIYDYSSFHWTSGYSKMEYSYCGLCFKCVTLVLHQKDRLYASEDNKTSWNLFNTSWITPSCPNFPKQRPIHSVRNNKLHISKMQMPSSESVLRACREQQMRLPSYNRWCHQRGRWDMIAQRPRI